MVVVFIIKILLGSFNWISSMQFWNVYSLQDGPYPSHFPFFTFVIFGFCCCANFTTYSHCHRFGHSNRIRSYMILCKHMPVICIRHPMPLSNMVARHLHTIQYKIVRSHFCRFFHLIRKFHNLPLVVHTGMRMLNSQAPNLFQWLKSDYWFFPF